MFSIEIGVSGTIGGKEISVQVATDCFVELCNNVFLHNYFRIKIKVISRGYVRFFELHFI